MRVFLRNPKHAWRKGLTPKLIPLMLFLDLVPSSLEDITHATRGCFREAVCFGIVSSVSKQKEHVNPMLWGYLPWYFQVMSEKQRNFGPRYVLIYFETVIGVQVPPAQTIKSEWTAEKWEAKHDEYKAKERPNTTQPSNPMVKSVDRRFLPR